MLYYRIMHLKKLLYITRNNCVKRTFYNATKEVVFLFNTINPKKSELKKNSCGNLCSMYTYTIRCIHARHMSHIRITLHGKYWALLSYILNFIIYFLDRTLLRCMHIFHIYFLYLCKFELYVYFHLYIKG